MAAHTKIIDLFGIPACGKSTLSNYICDHYGSELKICTMPQLVSEARKDGNRLRKAFSLGYFLAGIGLRMRAPLNKRPREIPIMNWPSHARYYSYAKKYSDYDIVMVDHGDIQDFVSLERGVDLHSDKRFSKACSSYIDQSLSDVYVYCNIEPETALLRMLSRGRETGRIDSIDNNAERLQELENERKRFSFYAEMLRGKDKMFLELDMHSPTEQIAATLMNQIKAL